LQTSDSGGSVVPLRSFFRDIATPLPSESCECHNPVSDGIEDLIFNFDLTEIIEALNLLSFPNQTIRLKLIGRMVENGGPADFIGVDCVQIPDNQTSPDLSLAVYALTKLTLRQGVRIFGGDVAVFGRQENLDRRDDDSISVLGAKVDGDIYGESVHLAENARVQDVYTNELKEEKARYRNIYPLNVSLPLPPTFPEARPGPEHFSVPPRSRLILTGKPGSIHLGDRSILVLKGGEYNVEEIRMGPGSRLEAEGPTRLMVSGRFITESKAYIGPARGSGKLNLHIVVKSTDINSIPRVIIGKSSQLNAVMSVPNGTIVFEERVKAQGAYMGDMVDIGTGSSIEHFDNLRSEYDPCGTPYCSSTWIEGLGFKVICVTSQPFPEGTSCSDGNACTEGDQCDGIGNCISGDPVPDPDPDNDLPCKKDECDPIEGINEPVGTICDVMVQCHEPTTCNDSGNCQVIGAELPQGTPCNDGIPNNGTDTCYQNGWCEGEFGPFNCLANNCGSPPNLECWLNEHPNVKYAINWIPLPGSQGLFYDYWEPWRKQQLQQAFEDAWNWHQSGMTNFQGTVLPEPLNNQEPLQDQDLPSTVLDETEAWPFYLAHVAHILMVEIKGLVPWTLCDYYSDPLDSMSELLQSNFFFFSSLSSVYPGYTIRGNVTPAHPTVTFSFMVDNGLIGTTRLETIGKVIDWARKMIHFMGPFTTLNMQYHWQYRGQPPVSRIISGTILDPIIGSGYPNPQNWTKGCGGTSNFIKEILRSVNIPVRVLTINQACPHATVYFPSEGRYLSHGDDPYTSFWKAETPNTLIPPMENLLLDQATYTSWFGGDPGTTCNNIGRGPYRLMIDYPPDPLVQMYCDDESQQKSHLEGAVYNYGFNTWYTVSELEAAGFWVNLAQRAAILGFCGN
jgi:hypothetical protein